MLTKALLPPRFQFNVKEACTRIVVVARVWFSGGVKGEGCRLAQPGFCSAGVRTGPFEDEIELSILVPVPGHAEAREICALCQEKPGNLAESYRTPIAAFERVSRRHRNTS